MFGYVMPYKPELKVRDFEQYRSIYCGLCKELGKRYGVMSRFLLNYDLVLVGLLADALSGDAGDMRVEGCFANPLLKKHTLHTTPGLELAADGLVMLSWHKLTDNLEDEKFGKKIAYHLAKPFIKHMYKRAAAARSEMDAVLKEQMKQQALLEQKGCAIADEACMPTALMCQAIFKEASQDSGQQKILARLGLFAGQIVYLLDAAEDYEKDKQLARYNVFVNQNLSREETIQAVQRRCRMAAGEIALCYNLLDIRQYKDILDNIFFLGLPRGIARAGIERTKGLPHGQIEGV